MKNILSLIPILLLFVNTISCLRSSYYPKPSQQRKAYYKSYFYKPYQTIKPQKQYVQQYYPSVAHNNPYVQYQTYGQDYDPYYMVYYDSPAYYQPPVVPQHTYYQTTHPKFNQKRYQKPFHRFNPLIIGQREETQTCHEEGYTRHLTDCTRFVKCTKLGIYGSYQIHTFKCPETLVFDEKLQICNYVERVPECQPTQYPPVREKMPVPTVPTKIPSDNNEKVWTPPSDDVQKEAHEEENKEAIEKHLEELWELERQRQKQTNDSLTQTTPQPTSESPSDLNKQITSQPSKSPPQPQQPINEITQQEDEPQQQQQQQQQEEPIVQQQEQQQEEDEPETQQEEQQPQQEEQQSQHEDEQQQEQQPEEQLPIQQEEQQQQQEEEPQQVEQETEEQQQQNLGQSDLDEDDLRANQNPIISSAMRQSGTKGGSGPVPPHKGPSTTLKPPIKGPTVTTQAAPIKGPSTTTAVPPIKGPQTTSTPTPPVKGPQSSTTPVPPVKGPTTTTPVPPVKRPTTTTQAAPIKGPSTTTTAASPVKGQTTTTTTSAPIKGSTEQLIGTTRTKRRPLGTTLLKSTPTPIPSVTSSAQRTTRSGRRTTLKYKPQFRPRPTPVQSDDYEKSSAEANSPIV